MALYSRMPGGKLRARHVGLGKASRRPFRNSLIGPHFRANKRYAVLVHRNENRRNQ
jgi:hypothetical protein